MVFMLVLGKYFSRGTKPGDSKLSPKKSARNKELVQQIELRNNLFNEVQPALTRGVAFHIHVVIVNASRQPFSLPVILIVR